MNMHMMHSTWGIHWHDQIARITGNLGDAATRRHDQESKIYIFMAKQLWMIEMMTEWQVYHETGKYLHGQNRHLYSI